MSKERYKKGGICTKRKNLVNHYDEVDFINRGIIGKAEGIIRKFKKDQRSCIEIIDELLSIAGWCRQVGLHILIRHLNHCLEEEKFPGTKDELLKEIGKVDNYYEEKLNPKKKYKKKFEHYRTKFDLY